MKNFLNTAHAPSFDDPLEMLLACHGKIQTQCATLQKLLPHLATHGCDVAAQQAAQGILRYFDTAGQYHHQDEELDLFPMLRATQNSEAAQLMARLLQEHLALEAAWKNLRPCLVAIQQGQADSLDAAIADTFIAGYQNHIALENPQLLPLAKQLLTSTQLANLGISMSKRRG